jgi:hypothetical protein
VSKSIFKYDFNTLVIANFEDIPYKIQRTLDKFNKAGITRFVILFPVNIRTTSYSKILSDLRNFRNTVLPYRPRGAKLIVYPSVYVEKGTLENPILKKLTIDGNRVFLRLPDYVDSWWLPSDINYLLYKQKLRPIFVSFEENLLNCAYEFGDKLYKTQYSQFCIDINYLTTFRVKQRTRVDKAIKRGAPMIPCISKPHPEYDTEQQYRFERLKNRLGNLDYYKLCMSLNENGRDLFKK